MMLVPLIIILVFLPEQADSSNQCRLPSEYYVYTDNEGKEEFKKCDSCPVCPLGKSPKPECGSRIRDNVTIMCERCIMGKTYSDEIGVESCKPCDKCGNRVVMQKCTRKSKQICATTICQNGYYFDTVTEDCQPEHSPATGNLATTPAAADQTQVPATGPPTFSSSTTGAPTVDDATTAAPSTSVSTTKAQATESPATGSPSSGSSTTSTGAPTVNYLTTGTQSSGPPPLEDKSSETKPAASPLPKIIGLAAFFGLLVVSLVAALVAKYRKKVAVSTVDEKRLTSQEKSDKPLLASQRRKSSDCYDYVCRSTLTAAHTVGIDNRPASKAAQPVKHKADCSPSVDNQEQDSHSEETPSARIIVNPMAQNVKYFPSESDKDITQPSGCELREDVEKTEVENDFLLEDEATAPLVKNKQNCQCYNKNTQYFDKGGGHPIQIFNFLNHCRSCGQNNVKYSPFEKDREEKTTKLGLTDDVPGRKAVGGKGDFKFLPENREYKLSELPFTKRQKIGRMLDNAPPGTANAITIAEHFDMEQLDLQDLHRQYQGGKNVGTKVLEFFVAKDPDLTVYQFCVKLNGREFSRKDIAEELCQLLKGTLRLEPEIAGT